jgi:hypothetical protein
MDKLQEACNQRKKHLKQMHSYLEYKRDTDELERWIAENMQVATADEYGQDYEHCLVSFEWLTEHL